MQPIETTWRGFRFRSRTEARWAVFLTAAGIRFEYEAEGFALPSGWYLPDFWLPERKQWLEIKGQSPTDRELQLARELAAKTHHLVLFGVGAPNPDNYALTVVDGDPNEPPVEWTMNLEGPASAYEAARSERFDGKPIPAAKPKQRDRWW